jgi:predicted metalloprotease with PDZ domain
LIDDTTYAKLLGKTIDQVAQTPGRRVQSVAQASFDAWIKYYRPDENTANATVSYYTKGALVALCLDLSLRAHGSCTLDAIMRALWQRCQGGPMSERDLLNVLSELTGRSWAAEIKEWVHSTRELPAAKLLSEQGLELHEDPAQLAQSLGLRAEDVGGSVKIKSVLAGGAAQAAGLMAGDEWLAVAVKPPSGPVQEWRLSKLDELAVIVGSQRRFTALVSRDKRLLRLAMRMPVPQRTLRLAIGSRSESQWPAS